MVRSVKRLIFFYQRIAQTCGGLVGQNSYTVVLQQANFLCEHALQIFGYDYFLFIHFSVYLNFLTKVQLFFVFLLI